MTPDIEFSARFPRMRELQGKTKEDRDLHRLIHGEEDGDDEIEFEIEYEYAPIVLNTDEIKFYFKYDKVHTTIKLYDGDAFVVKCKFNIFKVLMESLTGKVVRKLSDFKFEERLGAKATEIEKILKDMPPIPLNGTTDTTNSTNTTTD